MSTGAGEMLVEASVSEAGQGWMCRQCGAQHREDAISGDELLSAFAEAMHEWGHYRTAEGLRFPTQEETSRVAAGRRTDRGWNTDPLP